MLILDTPAQVRWADAGANERTRDQRSDALEREIQSSIVSINLDDEWDCTSLEQRIGRPLATEEVKRRLLLCNPNLIIEPSIRYPEMTGIYFEKDERTAAGSWVKRKVFLFTLSSAPVMPEKEVVHVRMKRVPNPEVVAGAGKEIAREAVHWIEIPEPYDYTRGWRTVLIRLLKAELLTRADVEKHFGWTCNSRNWAEQT